MAHSIVHAIVPVILSGGSGQRLWPLSRELHPKQFINLMSARSLFQETAARLSGGPFSKALVVCNSTHRFLVAEHLRDAGIEPQAIVLEQTPRNTAPAAALAALLLMRRNSGAMMLLAPSDHVIAKPEKFIAAVSIAAEAAAKGRLVTFGITPDHPATGYGYILKGDAIDGIDGCFASTGSPKNQTPARRQTISPRATIFGTAAFSCFPPQPTSKPWKGSARTWSRPAERRSTKDKTTLIFFAPTAARLKPATGNPLITR